jgi:hypothetical protein
MLTETVKRFPHITEIQKLILVLFEDACQVSIGELYRTVQRVFTSVSVTTIREALLDLQAKDLVSPSIYIAHCRFRSLKQFKEMLKENLIDLEWANVYILNEDLLRDVKIMDHNFPWEEYPENSLVAIYSK